MFSLLERFFKSYDWEKETQSCLIEPFYDKGLISGYVIFLSENASKIITSELAEDVLAKIATNIDKRIDNLDFNDSRNEFNDMYIISETEITDQELKASRVIVTSDGKPLFKWRLE